jgi:peptidyl-prolyl cis-trans isomerase SurA
MRTATHIGVNFIAFGLLVAALCPWFMTEGEAANPYSPARTVNGQVITDYDIAQRADLLDALGAKGDLQGIALEQLTEDRLKVQAGEQVGFELPEDAILGGIEEFAAARGVGVDEVLGILEARNIDRQTMDDYVEAGLVWREVVSARFRAESMPSESDVDAALRTRANTPIKVYQIAEIALPYAERGRAATEQLAEDLARELALGEDFSAAARQFSRSESAVRGGEVPAMPLAAMPGPLQAAVRGVPPGGIAGPVPIAGGVAIIKVLDIRNERPRQSPEETEFDRREAMRRELFGERITAFGEGYLQELRAEALIADQ